jgi:redox-sensitive bicupin YhaK (pirin superfamily)
MPDSARSAVSAPAAKAVGEFTVPSALGPDRMPARRAFVPEHSRPFDPFLMFVEFGPRELHETGWGFGPHPHKGFETITYMLEGGIEHRDSAGGHAVLGSGDVQWMTAGGGIVHSEEPPARLREHGGIVHGFQIWLNLPAALKEAPPGFSVLRGAEIPLAEPAPGVAVRVIGGRCGTIESPVRLRSPVFLWHVTLAPGARWSFAKADGWSALAYAFSEAERGRMTVFDRAGEIVSLAHDGAAALELLVLGGQPFDEPIASHGPFVMTTREEIIAAIRDYQSGRMGSLSE